MSVLLCLGDTSLTHAASGKKFAERIGELNLFESDELIRDRNIILTEAYILKREEAVSSLETVKIFAAESSRDLSGSVGSEIIENNGIVGLDRGNGLAVLFYYERNNELVGNACVIGSLDALCGGLSLIAFAVNERCIALLNTVPVLIAVHYIVTALNRSNLTYAELSHLGFELSNIILARCGRCVTSVEEAVNIYLL